MSLIFEFAKQKKNKSKKKHKDSLADWTADANATTHQRERITFEIYAGKTDLSDYFYKNGFSLKMK